MKDCILWLQKYYKKEPSDCADRIKKDDPVKVITGKDKR